MLALHTDVGTPSLNGPFSNCLKNQSVGNNLRIQRFGALNIAFAALHSLDKTIDRSDFENCVIGSGAYTIPAQVMFL